MKANEFLTWMFTVIAAVAIIGAAVLYVKRQQALMPQDIVVTAPVDMQRDSSSAPDTLPDSLKETVPDLSHIEQPPQGQAYTPSAPQKPISDKKATLDLSRIAGLITLDVPFMRIRDKIPLEHSCFQENTSPAVTWKNAPPETKSYVVFMERRGGIEGNNAMPDVTSDVTPHVNWIVYNIPADKGGLGHSLPRIDTLPDGASQATSDSNIVGYYGPCEAMGKFTYALRVFALDKILEDVPGGIAKNDLIHAMNGHIIDASEVSFIHYRRF